MNKYIVLLVLLLYHVASAFAQENHFARAERVYALFVDNQGDSIHALLSKKLQGELSPVVFKDMFLQTERQFGKLQSAGEWQKEDAQGITLYYRNLVFERYSLRFLLSFDADGCMNTIRLVPVPAASTAKPVAYDKSRLEERGVTVGVDGFKLPGTLTLPVGKKKVPVVVLVHGSGPQDRDETLGPNKPFRDLAWGLAERGIATLRYDKRTKVYGNSFVPQGREADYDTECVDDAVSAVRLASGLPEVDAGKVYVLGHSLGATLAPRIAERADGLAGVILVAGLVRPLEDAMREQMAYLASLTNSPVDEEQLAEIKRQVPPSYWEAASAYKPVEVAAKLTLPMLVLQGERDYQVTMEDFGLWRMGLLRHKNAFFKSYPKLNHLLQEGSGKSTPFEYNHASPVPAYVMDDIASFVTTATLLH